MYDVIMKAMKGDGEARQQLYVWAYLWPRLEKAFAPPRGDYELASILALASLGPQPEPPDLPGDREVAISAMKRFHERLVAVADQIAAEIAVLEAGKGEA